MVLADLAWRTYRKNHGEDLARFEKEILGFQKYLLSQADSQDLTRLKEAFELIPMPGAVPYNLLRAQALTEPWLHQGATFFSAYRQTKRIYSIDPILWEALGKSRWPGKCPIEAFRLPINGMVLEIKREGDERPTIFGLYYDHSTGREATGHLEIRILNVGYPPSPGAVFDLANCKTIDDAWEGVMAKIYARLPGTDYAIENKRQAWKDEVRGCINTVLYILGNEDVVKEVHPGSKAKKAYADPEKQRRADDLKDPDIRQVGNAYASAIERWEEAERSSRDVGEGGAHHVRPHIRAAHPHLYWTGEGRKIPIVKFLPPIQVHGGEDPRESVIKVR